MHAPLLSWLRCALAMLIAGSLCLLFTPPVRRFALALGAVDRPGGRRVNTRPVPRMGGLAMALGFLSAAAMLCRFDLSLAGLLTGSLLIAALGAADDRFSLPPRLKLAGQTLAALTAVRGGIVIRALALPGLGLLSLGRLPALGLTVLWIVACTNAVNLIDGLDGLAAGVSAISSLTLLAAALCVSGPEEALLPAALAGACLGFLPYNRNPARIFMGDAGSQFLGYVLSLLSIRGLFKFHTAISLFVPLLALSLPLADTVFAVVRRLGRGQSLFAADRGHIHHRLLDRGLSQRQAVALLYAVSSVLGLAAVLLAGSDPLLRLGCLALIFLLLRLIRAMLTKSKREL